MYESVGEGVPDRDDINLIQLSYYPNTEVDPQRAEFAARGEDVLQRSAIYAVNRALNYVGPDADIERDLRIAAEMREDAARLGEAAGIEYDLFGTSDIGPDTFLDMPLSFIINPPNLKEQ